MTTHDCIILARIHAATCRTNWVPANLEAAHAETAHASGYPQTARRLACQSLAHSVGTDSPDYLRAKYSIERT